MQKILKIFVLSWLASFGLVAQITVLDESLLTESSFNTFTTVSVSGQQTWSFSPVYGAVCNGFSAGQSYQNEDWLISAAMDLSQLTDAQLTFSHTRGNASVLNVGISQGWYKVFATANYTGNPATTQWVEISGVDHAVPNAWQYIPSGELSIPETARSSATRIAFRYQSSASQSATWEVKNVRVTAEPIIGENQAAFKITSWNTEWFGCTQFGPQDESLQIVNVASAMLAMNSDIYCLQEVTHNALSPTLSVLVSVLGSDQWDAKLVPGTTADCDQRQAIIYKKSRVQFVSAALLDSGNPAQNNTYYHNWGGGRYPAVYNVNLVAGSASIPVTIVNIHAKAEDGNPTSYTRRLGASQALKEQLDGSAFNSKNLLLVGDFNDFLIGTNSEACQCTISPYKNFMDDQANYAGLTQNLFNSAGNPPIQNIIISNELASNFIPGTALREMSVPQQIADYYTTTSNHVPISARFVFSTLKNEDFTAGRDKVLTIYPNPVKDYLQISTADDENAAEILVYDLTGRKMQYVAVDSQTIGVAELPSGIYILKVGSQVARFVKQ